LPSHSARIFCRGFSGGVWHLYRAGIFCRGFSCGFF